MRRFVAHIVPVLIVSLAWLVPGIASAQAVASWNETVHDYGTFHENDGPQTCLFEVTNTGNSPLILVSVKSTCGCTVAEYTTEPIAPGSKGYVEVTYSPTGRPGPFSKSVMIITNAQPDKTKLSIEGIVIGSSKSVDEYYPEHAGDLRLNRTTLAAGEIRKGVMRNSTITAYNATADTVVMSFDNNTSHITIKTTTDTIAPGATSTISFFFYSSRTPLWGINDDKLTILTKPLHSEGEPKRAELNLVANVVEDFSYTSDEDLAKAPVCSVSTQRIVLDKLDCNDAAEAVLTIENTGRDNLIIHRLMSLDKSLVVKCDKTMLVSGEKAVATVSVDPAKMSDKVLNSQFTVISNDPANPRIVVRVVGLIQN